MNLFLALFLLFSITVYSQTENYKWSKKIESFEYEVAKPAPYSFNRSTVSSFSLSVLNNGYRFFISDLDGDNCPFHPSCSAFFMQSVKSKGIAQGSLMFADRFLRDTNIFKRRGQYSMHSSGKLYDPITNYTLRNIDIIYIPRDIVVD
ncbi:MAG: membrane protein insertion efficiency factor YidD [Bacteroidota bacterium]